MNQLGFANREVSTLSRYIDKFYHGLLGPFSLFLVSNLIVQIIEPWIFPVRFGSPEFVYYYSLHTGNFLLYLSTLVVYFVFGADIIRQSLPTNCITPPYKVRISIQESKINEKIIRRAGIWAILLLYGGFLAAALIPVFGFIPMSKGSIYTGQFEQTEIIDAFPAYTDQIPIISDMILIRDYIHSPSPTGYLLILISGSILYLGMQNILFLFRHRDEILEKTDPSKSLVHLFVKWMPHVGSITLVVIIVMEGV